MIEKVCLYSHQFEKSTYFTNLIQVSPIVFSNVTIKNELQWSAAFKIKLIKINKNKQTFQLVLKIWPENLRYSFLR